MAEKKERDYSVVAAIVLVGVPVLIFFALDYTVLPYWKSGTVEAARLISTAEGDRLFVIESVSDGEDSDLERMSVYDPAHLGAKPVKTYTRDEVSFAGYAGGRLWFSSDHDEPGWHARDPLTLEITVTQDDLEKADPRLRRLHTGRFTGDGLDLSTLDGYELHVDAGTLAIADVPKERGGSWDEPDIETAYGVTLPDGATLALSGQTRVGLTRDEKPLGSETFLQPKFLRPRRGDGAPFVLASPESVLISHRKTVQYDSPVSISRVATEDGRVLWTRGLGGEKDLEEVALSGDFLVVVAHESARTIWVKDGSVAAEVGY